jgi:endoglucanase
MQTRARSLDEWLSEILRRSTAPFHEQLVTAPIKAFARERGLGLKEDRAGNLVLEYRRPRRGQQPVAFTCHTDHPGFEVIAVRGRTATLRLLGGVDEPTLRNSRILLLGAAGPVRAEVLAVKMAKDRRVDDTTLRVRCAAPVAVGDWGHFDLVRLSLAGGKIRSKALDNVLSAALILKLLDDFSADERPAHVYGVFTVAEEVGFVGAMELMKSNLLPRRVPMVVMETSRELPGFKIGAGPVVRVGDRLSVYDDELTRWLTETAEALAKREPGFRFQRALMPGGACEASLYQLEGRPTCALAIALANYHNMGRRGAAAEWVSRSDAEQMLMLLTALTTSGPKPGRREELRRLLWRQHRRYAARFRRGAPKPA